MENLIGLVVIEILDSDEKLLYMVIRCFIELYHAFFSYLILYSLFLKPFTVSQSNFIKKIVSINIASTSDYFEPNLDLLLYHSVW